METAPLHAVVCRHCWWMQLANDTPDEVEVGGPPATATSSTIRRHAEDLVTWLRTEHGISRGHRILEVASHGNVLAAFLHAGGLTDTLTVERHPSALADARAAGVRVVEGRLDPALASKVAARRGFDLVLDTFDLAHRRSPGDELAGIARALDPDGIAIIEVEHVLPLLEHARFDSIRHGHFGYPSLIALRDAGTRHGLDLFAATATPMYGGSLRVGLVHHGRRPVEPSVELMVAEESKAGIGDLPLYANFAPRVAHMTTELRGYLDAARRGGRRVVGYGAPSRAGILLNAAGIDRALVACTADASPAKQGREIPGTGIPIVDQQRLVEEHPDEVLVLAWTIADEVVEQLVGAGLRGCRFVIPLPQLRFIDG